MHPERPHPHGETYLFGFLRGSTQPLGDDALPKRYGNIKLPMPAATAKQQTEIAALLELVLAARATCCHQNSPPKAGIDTKVAALYGLAPEEAQLADSVATA